MSLQGKEVLIIDDSEDVRQIERKIFENLGLVVTEAASVDSALLILKKRTPHLIILDLEMPVKTGFDFLALRAKSTELKAVPVIVASSHHDKASVHKALSLGAVNYVLKPINSAVMGQRVRKHARSLDYMQYDYPSAGQPDVSLHIKGQITSIGETDFTLASPVRLAKSCALTLIPPSIDKIDLTGYVLMSASDTSGRSLSGRYISKINVMGLKETISKQMKKRAKL
jgi:CheY-like chemotaxis protein